MMMTVEAFRRSLAEAAPPANASLALRGLWWAGKGDWEQAHGCAQQQQGDSRCDLVHAYLHRHEGAMANARYWYRRAGQPFPTIPLQDEWDALAAQLLSQE